MRLIGSSNWQIFIDGGSFYIRQILIVDLGQKAFLGKAACVGSKTIPQRVIFQFPDRTTPTKSIRDFFYGEWENQGNFDE